MKRVMCVLLTLSLLGALTSACQPVTTPSKAPETALPTHEYEPSPTTEAKFDIGDILKVTNTRHPQYPGLRIRKDDPTGEIVKRIPDGWALRVIGGPKNNIQGHNWWEIEEIDYEPSPTPGWVAEDYLEEVPLTEHLIPSSLPDYFVSGQDKVKQAIEWATHPDRKNKDWENLCLWFVMQAFGIDNIDWGCPQVGIPNCPMGGVEELTKEDMFFSFKDCYNPPRGALIFFSGKGSDPKSGINYTECGHIGIYLGDGEVAHAYGDARVQDLTGRQGIEAEEYIDYYIGWAYPPENWLSTLEQGYTERYTLVTSASPSAGGDIDPSGGIYDEESQVTLTAIPAPGYAFDHWGGDASGTLLSVNITMDSDKSVTAHFIETVLERYTLIVYVDGKGSVSPGGGSYDKGTRLTLTASPDSRWRFDHWNGTDDNSANPTTVTMNSNRTVTAYFESIMPDFAWIHRTDLPQATAYSVGAVVFDKIYVMGGHNSRTNYQYDTARNSWTTKSELPNEGVREGGAAVANNKIYVVDGSYGYDVMIYDPASDSWVTGNDLAAGRRRGIGVVAVNGKVYAIGGTDSELNGLNTVEEYDPSNNTWTRKADMPTARGFAAVCVVDGLIYAIGGRDSSSHSEILNTVEIYDPITDSWSTGTPMTTARSAAAIGVINGKIYVIGGFNGSHLDTVEEYNPTEDIWMTMNNMSVPRVGAVAGVVNDKIYVIGGMNDSGEVATVEEGKLQ